MLGEFDGFFIILKKLGETLHYVSCFSLHYSRAPAASCVLHNRVQASLLQETNYLKCTPARCRLCCFGYANYLLICFCLILSSRTGSTLHSHETWLFRKTIEVKTFIKLLCNIISKKRKVWQRTPNSSRNFQSWTPLFLDHSKDCFRHSTDKFLSRRQRQKCGYSINNETWVCYPRTLMKF